MENFLFPPEKVKGALFDYQKDLEKSYTMHYFIVINAQTGRPQNFAKVFSDHNIPSLGLGGFMDAQLDIDELAPVEIYDRETALYLIGQDAIQRSLCPDRLRDEVNDSPIFRLVPVFGAMIPNCVTQNDAQ